MSHNLLTICFSHSSPSPPTILVIPSLSKNLFPSSQLSLPSSPTVSSVIPDRIFRHPRPDRGSSVHKNRPFHGQKPHFASPVHKNRPFHGQKPHFASPVHKNRPFRGQKPHFWQFCRAELLRGLFCCFGCTRGYFGGTPECSKLPCECLRGRWVHPGVSKNDPRVHCAVANSDE